MNEFDFIKAIKPSAYRQSSLIKGIGDDAAVFRQSHADIVTAVDTFVEGVHFSKETMSAREIGYRALAVNISDMAAMGAVPAMCLVSIVFSSEWNDEERIEIMKGIKSIGKQYQVDLIGGDTVSGKSLIISITIIGYVEKDNARYRSTAEVDDVVFVTGTLGDAAAGLSILLGEQSGIDAAAYYIRRHIQPQPRVDFVQELKDLKRITLNDVSDGIANEAAEIAEASQIDVYLDDSKIPVHTSFYQFDQKQQYAWKYFGGEDFEIIGTVPREKWEKVKEAAANVGVQVTEIGHVQQGNGRVYIIKDGKTEVLPKDGYEHKEIGD